MEDLTGQTFERLTVLGFDYKNNSNKIYWKCQCSCGNIKSYRSDLLKCGRRKSCGCIHSPKSEEYLKKVEKRLLNQSKRVGECLEWTGRLNPMGYGIFKLRSSETKGLTYVTPKRSNISLSTHRVAYKIWVGDIPKGLYVLHRCDNRLCIEPSHMYLGTHQDNMNDMMKKNRQNKRPGALHHMTNFTEKEIIEIRRLWKEGLETQTGLSRKYKVGLSTIHNIVRRKTWAHI